LATEIVANHNDIINIENKVDFQLHEMQLKMTVVGGTANIIGGLIVIWVLFGQVPFSHLIGWFTALAFFNLINITVSLYTRFYKLTPVNITFWTRIYHGAMMPPVCIIWGVMGILFFNPEGTGSQIYLYILLLLVVFSFALATISDFVASAITISLLTLPFIGFRFFLGAQSYLTTGKDPHLYIAFAAITLILYVILLVSCYIGYRLIKKSSVISFENIALNEQLENANKVLEQRVQERTVELQDSLKLVTYQANHDLLTGLPSRQFVSECIDKAMKRATENNHLFALVFFSINELDKIKDSRGIYSGESVIKTIANRFKRKYDKQKPNSSCNFIVAILRQDIFLILIDPIFNTNEAEERSQSIFSVVDEPVYIDKEKIMLTASMGVSLFPREGHEPNKLLMASSAALTQAKMRGGNSLVVYSPNDVDEYKQLTLASGLHTAVINNELVLYYQPLVNLLTRKIESFEALIRWIHPSLGFVPPGNFISLAEANGTIIQLGEWALRAACSQLREWHSMGFEDLKISVNFSSKQFQDKNIVKLVTNILDSYNIDPKYIEVELTESAAFHNDAVPIIKQFRSLGFPIVIDDFGTGYSGLTNLKSFPIDKIKIDQTFVKDLSTNPDSAAIIMNTLSLAKSLKADTVAEGVETDHQLKFLQMNGCNLIQGYYFSKPINAADATNLLINGIKNLN
jgi:diguanylate cyclase (GGDEF)-like protein